MHIDSYFDSEGLAADQGESGSIMTGGDVEASSDSSKLVSIDRNGGDIEALRENGCRHCFYSVNLCIEELHQEIRSLLS